MNIPNITLNKNFSLPMVGKGNWMTNLRKKQKHIDGDDLPAIEILQAAIDGGITYIDTAERYANGYGETLIGRAIKKYDRKKLFLVSKVSGSNLSFDDIIISAKASLKRMHCAYFDLYLIHEYNAKLPLKESMRAMDLLIDQGLIKATGVCNFTIEQLKEAQSHTKNKVAANQLHYNYMFRDMETSGIIGYCQKNEIAIIAWRPFQSELLKGDAMNLLDELSLKYKKTPLQIANLWLMAQPNTVSLSRFDKTAQLDEISDILGMKIDSKDLDRLSKVIN